MTEPTETARVIRAPWTSEQVDALNAFQERGGMHPFTCGAEAHPVHLVLLAHRDGWRCSDPACGYRQDWAHAFMADPQAWPKFPFGDRYDTPAHVRAAAVPAPATDRECVASISGHCLAEGQSETACDTDAGECVHGGKPATNQAGARFGPGEGVHGRDPYYAATDQGAPVCKFDEGCHRVVACDPGCGAPLAATDQAALRDRIAAAIWERQNPGRRWADCEHPWGADAEEDADAVLAMLPAPADRVAILLKAARILRDASGSYGSPAYDYELGPGLADAANRLDAMAGEAQEQLDEAEAQAHLDALAPIAEGTPLPALDGPTLYEKLTTMFSGPLPPWPDSRPDLITFRERIAEDLYAHDHPNWRIPLRESDVEPVYRERAVAVLTGLRDMVRMAAEAAPADTGHDDSETEGQAPPVCQGFVWIGQPFTTCERCGQPAWEHDGEEIPVEGAGPFDNCRTVRPWKPGQADAIRARWAPEQPAAAQQPKEA